MTSPVRRERGAAVVEYVLVSGLLLFIGLGVVQVALVLHARNVLVADAAEGARAAAVAGASLSDGERACTVAIARSLSAAVARAVSCRAVVERPDLSRPALVAMRVAATLPMTFVPLGHVHIDVVAHAVVEPP